MYLKRIEELRVDHDYTQDYVAKHLGLAREVYRRYEKGTRSLPVDVLINLTKLYNVTSDYILEIGNR